MAHESKKLIPFIAPRIYPKQQREDVVIDSVDPGEWFCSKNHVSRAHEAHCTTCGESLFDTL